MHSAWKGPRYFAVSAQEVGVNATGSPPTLVGRVGDSAAGRCLGGTGAELEAARARRRHGRAAHTRRRVALTDKARQGLLLTQPIVEGLAGGRAREAEIEEGRQKGSKQAQSGCSSSATCQRYISITPSIYVELHPDSSRKMSQHAAQARHASSHACPPPQTPPCLSCKADAQATAYPSTTAPPQQGATNNTCRSCDHKSLRRQHADP